MQKKLAGDTGAELFVRHGKPVVEQSFERMDGALDAALRELRLEDYETAAVLVMTAAEADYAAGYLKSRLEEAGFDTKRRFSCLDRNSTRFCRGLTVTTFYHAKGLEFDQVFIVFPAEDFLPLARQAKYICATRAMHELYTYKFRLFSDF